MHSPQMYAVSGPSTSGPTSRWLFLQKEQDAFFRASFAPPEPPPKSPFFAIRSRPVQDFRLFRRLIVQPPNPPSQPSCRASFLAAAPVNIRILPAAATLVFVNVATRFGRNDVAPEGCGIVPQPHLKLYS